MSASELGVEKAAGMDDNTVEAFQKPLPRHSPAVSILAHAAGE